MSAPAPAGGREPARGICRRWDQAPAILLVTDEIEALTRNRRALSSHADLRAVSQLLSLMDGLRRAKGVFVVGTTNQVELIDPAFRRPGRFDREIEIGEPDEQGRLEILAVQTRSMPLSAEARAVLPQLAQQTVGFRTAPTSPRSPSARACPHCAGSPARVGCVSPPSCSPPARR